GQDENALKEQMREDAGKRVKTNLTLEAIVKAENLDVSDEDVNAELETMAGMYGTDKEQLKQMLGGNLDAIKEDLLFRKAIDFLVENKKTIALLNTKLLRYKKQGARFRTLFFYTMIIVTTKKARIITLFFSNLKVFLV